MGVASNAFETEYYHKETVVSIVVVVQQDKGCFVLFVELGYVM